VLARQNLSDEVALESSSVIVVPRVFATPTMQKIKILFFLNSFFTVYTTSLSCLPPTPLPQHNSYTKTPPSDPSSS